MVKQRKHSISEEWLKLGVKILFFVDICETDASTSVHIVFILIAYCHVIILFTEPSFRNLNSAFLLVVIGLNDFSVDVKDVDLFPLKIDVSIGNLLEIVKVEFHLHEPIVNFTRMKVNMERVVNRSFFDKTLSSAGLFFC